MDTVTVTVTVRGMGMVRVTGMVLVLVRGMVRVRVTGMVRVRVTGMDIVRVTVTVRVRGMVTNGRGGNMIDDGYGAGNGADKLIVELNKEVNNDKRVIQTRFIHYRLARN